MMDTVSLELLRGIAHHTIDLDSDVWHIATDARKHPLSAGFALTSKALRRATADCYYRAFTFEYVSSIDGAHSPVHRTAAKDLYAWLRTINTEHRSYVRKLRLEMYGSEFLMLFAPAEAAKLLHLPRDSTAPRWTTVLSILQSFGLLELTIVILPQTCPSPCASGEKKLAAGTARPEAEHSKANHFEIDHRWIVKAVTESMRHLPSSALKFVDHNGMPCSNDHIANMTWAMLHSSTAGFHSCDRLTSTGERYTSWATEEHDPKVMYRVPIVVTGSHGAGKDVLETVEGPFEEILGFRA